MKLNSQRLLTPSSVLIFASFALLASCSSDDSTRGTNPKFEAGTDDAETPDAAGTEDVVPDGANVDAPISANTPEAQILTALSDVHLAEAELAETAAVKAHDFHVASLATILAADHRADAARIAQLMTQLRITPQPGLASAAFAARIINWKSDLASSTGADFDRAYLNDVASAEDMIVKRIDNDFIPSSPSLSTLSEITRERAIELRHAKLVVTAQDTVFPTASADGGTGDSAPPADASTSDAIAQGSDASDGG